MIKLNIKKENLPDQADWLGIQDESSNIKARFGLESKPILSLELECALQDHNENYDLGNSRNFSIEVFKTGEDSYCAVVAALNLKNMISVTIAVTPFIQEEAEFDLFEKINNFISAPRKPKIPYFSKDENKDLSDFINLIIKNRIYNTSFNAEHVDDTGDTLPNKRGGKRDNSGRKPSSEPRISMNIKLAQKLADYARSQKNTNGYIAELIRADLEKAQEAAYSAGYVACNDGKALDSNPQHPELAQPAIPNQPPV